MRVPQKPGAKGSQKWFQRLVNRHPEVLAGRVVAACRQPLTDAIEFVSPLAADDFAEYRDDSFLRRLAIQPATKQPVSTFWPRGGPQWDGLARSTNSNLFLFEAKSHIRELVGPGCAASPTSRPKIQHALDATKRYCGVPKDVSWLGDFYQHANRIAHLYWLRVVQQQPAHLIYVLFTGDHEMRGPASETEWRGALSLMEQSMGLQEHPLSPFIHHVFVDVSELNRSA